MVIVDAKALAEVPESAVALRSQQVADIEPAAVTQIEIQARGDTFSLKRGPSDWELTAPRKEKADTVSVMSFLNRIDALETSEFFQPNQVGNPELDRPVMTVKIWEKGRPQSPGSSPAEEPALVLRIGKHDLLRKTVFARLENDDAILALPDTILEVLPKNEFAFRDLTMLSINPADIRKLTVTRAGRTDELEPNKGGEPNRWRLRRPIDAPADTRSVTQILAMLSNLRADQLITDSVGDGKNFGLDHPLLEIVWETDRCSSPQGRLAGPASRGLLRAGRGPAVRLHDQDGGAQTLGGRASRSCRADFPGCPGRANRAQLGLALSHRRFQAPRANRRRGSPTGSTSPVPTRRASINRG